MKPDKNYYITTAIAYTSAKPHIGNVYEIVLTDSIARFKRAQGYNVYFQTGTDEHGQKIEEYAKNAGRTPKEHVDEISSIIRNIFDDMNISYDHFIRTTDEYHKEQVQKVFKKLLDKGDLYKGVYEGWYCQSCEAYYSEVQLEEEGICPVCGAQLIFQEEESYFFKLSEYQDRLIKHIEANPEFIQPESRKNEMIQNFLKEPLYDLAVTRTSFEWGIPVEFDEKHIVYVWIDALINYITGLGFDIDGNHGEKFNEFWPADVHVIGKDILRFHTIYWPILLMALDIELPKQIFGHPWLLVNDGKMSKSKGNVLYTDELVDVFGVDAVRYIMLREMPFERDGHISYESMIERINTDLANITGNLVNRTIAMTNKYFDGVISVNDVYEEIDRELIEMAEQTTKKVIESMNNLRVQDAIKHIIELFRRSNKYIDETTPWVLAKDESKQDRLQTVLYNLLESIRIGAVLLQSFIPETADKILNQLNTDQRSMDSVMQFGQYPLNNRVIEKPEVLFKRLDIEETLKLFEKEEPFIKEDDMISFEEFSKLDMRTGKIISGEKHPNADKLYVLKVDIGETIIQVVSGLVDHFELKDLIGKEVVVVVNLKPANLRGVESNGMILAAKDNKKMTLVTAPNVVAGTKLS
ncbi:MAG: methionine--tRNA ligase [Erysipelothrix sp.]|nr:methionine--tRNA ligase [Erysipelothrix sp.]